jgi:sigma-B regulation protein RsbU (phosphoserine phosphatase)
MIAKAGAPRPILVREGQIQEIKIDGTPLGMFAGTEYETVTLALQPNDILVFASDGILESMNAQDQPFGFERLTKVLCDHAHGHSAHSISTAILEATDEFSGRPREAHDDRTLIVLRLTESRQPQPSASSD